MPGIIFVDVDEGENCPFSLQLVFSALEEPRPIRQVRLYQWDKEGSLYDVVGWSEGGPCAALGVSVEDSGQGHAYLIYGGGEGVRLRPAGSSVPWTLSAADQRGESHLLLADAEDLVWE